MDEIILETTQDEETKIEKAKYQTPKGTTWKMMPDSLDSEGDLSLYSGTPGIVLWLLQMHANQTGRPVAIHLPDKPKVDIF